ncbi:MAG: hypothetical protein IJD83_05240 [Clostridia bacterium]|nr:hypothetical protein [Clostridia bacterium]
MKTVTFCGHRTLSIAETERLRVRLYAEIEKMIFQGAAEFLLGGYGDFDRLCAKTVKALQAKYPHIKSVLVIPYLNREYNTELYDCTEYPPIEAVPPRYAIVKRNAYMVERAEIVIAYVKYTFGGAWTTLEYAKRRKKTIIVMD